MKVDLKFGLTQNSLAINVTYHAPGESLFRKIGRGTLGAALKVADSDDRVVVAEEMCPCIPTMRHAPLF